MITDDFYGDKFRWFVGVVKDVGDDRSRVRVRIFGIHHTEDTTKVSDGDLPWALVLLPTTSGASGGTVAHGLTPGTWVVGFFADHLDSQQPVVLGVINGGQGSTDTSPRQFNNTDPGSAGNNTSNPGSNRPESPANTGAIQGDTSGTFTSQLEGGSNPQKVYNYFWQKLTAEGAYSGDLKSIVSALVGHLQNESGVNIDPQAKNGKDWNREEGNQASYGITQWRTGKYDRYGPMLRFNGINTYVQPPNLPPLERQLDYMWHEFHTSEKPAYKKLLVATNLQDAMIGVYMFGRGTAWKQVSKGVWRVDTTEKTFVAKMNFARKIYSSMSYTGSATSRGAGS